MLSDAITKLFAVPVDVSWLSPLPVDLPLDRDEAGLVAGAVPTRRREFAAGRWLAHRALERLGLEAGPLLAGPMREPLWPPGAVGSISHTRDLCMVAVGRGAEVRSVGLDVEDDAPLERELWDLVCTPAESPRTPDPDEAGRLVRRLFTAKEAFYKFQFPISGAFLEFHDVAVTFETAERFVAELLRPGVPGFAEGSRAHGCLVAHQGWVIAGVAEAAR